jgi:DNA gyrase/topoisomerase IV subunit A
VLIGSLKAMTIHFRLSDEELRPLGRTARGVRAMNLREGDRLVSMDVLPAELADRVASSAAEEAADDSPADDDEGDEVAAILGFREGGDAAEAANAIGARARRAGRRLGLRLDHAEMPPGAERVVDHGQIAWLEDIQW